MIAFRQSIVQIGVEPMLTESKSVALPLGYYTTLAGINQPNYIRKEDFNVETAISTMQEIGIEPNIGTSNDILISIAMYYLISTNSPTRSHRIQRVSTPLCNVD